MKRMTKLTLAMIALFTTPLAFSGQVVIPNTFTSGTPAVAADVNGDFSAVENAVNDNDTRITTNANGVASNQSGITSNTNAIASIQSNLHVMVQDGSGNAIGRLIGIKYITGLSGNEYAYSVLTSQGYLLLNLATKEGLASSYRTPNIYFTTLNCTGTPYTDAPNGTVFASYDASGQNSLYYVDKTSVPTKMAPSSTYNSSGGCTYPPASNMTLWPAMANSTAVTGVSNTAYALPITISYAQ